jgi:phosphate/sulfate permease
MSSRWLSLLSWLLDRVLAFVFAYIMLKGVRKITRHQQSDQLAIDTAAQSAK